MLSFYDKQKIRKIEKIKPILSFIKNNQIIKIYHTKESFGYSSNYKKIDVWYFVLIQDNQVLGVKKTRSRKYFVNGISTLKKKNWKVV